MKRYATYLGAIAIGASLHLISLARVSAIPLASDQVRILGVRLEVSPAALDAPRNVPILIDTALKDGGGSDVSSSPTFADCLAQRSQRGRRAESAELRKTREREPE